MQYRRLGNSGAVVTAWCLGTMTFGAEADETTSHKIIDTYVAAGGNFIDTADVYAGGKSEEIIGRWLKAHPAEAQQVVLATKGRFPMGNGPNDLGLSRRHLNQALEASLKRLDVEHIDLYQMHAWDALTPIEETLRFLDDAVASGKIGYFGFSNFLGWHVTKAVHVARAQGFAAPVTLQPQYSLVERGEFEGPLEDLCLKEKVGVIGYYSLASGFLTGKYRSAADMEGRARGSRVQKYLNDYGLGVLKALDDVAKRYNAKPGQIAIAWLIARPSVTAPIASATNLEQLDELMGAARLALPAEVWTRLDAAGGLGDPPAVEGRQA